jgi:hypothetical protein
VRKIVKKGWQALVGEEAGPELSRGQ